MFTKISTLLCKRLCVLPVRRYYQKAVFQIHVLKTLYFIFYILLTVQHLDVILVNDQLDALFLNVFISRLYMFRAQVLIIRRVKLY
jgi:hypothetical protein